MTARAACLLALLLAGCGDDDRASAHPAPAEQTERPSTEDEPREQPPEGFERFEGDSISFLHPASMEVSTESEAGVASAKAEGDGMRFIVLSSPDVVSAEEATALQRRNVAAEAVQRGGRIVEDNQAPSRTVAGAEREGRRFVFDTRDGIEHADIYSFGLGDRTVTVILSYPDEMVGHEDDLDRMASSLRVGEPGEP